jgi:hypothetical protein
MIPVNKMRTLLALQAGVAVLIAMLTLPAAVPGAHAQAPDQPPATSSPVQAAPQSGDLQSGDMQIVWEVRNRFRLFKEERDFQLHAEALRGHTILQSEDILAQQSDGRGWARNLFQRLCIDQTGRVSQPCTRDKVPENYMTPADHAITVRLAGQVPAGAVCAWSFDDGDGPQQSSFDCAEPINMRVRYGRTTVATVDVSTGPEVPQRLTANIVVRDILIAGLGDSIASGEGNPDRPIALTDEGFCFRSYLGGAGSQYYRPGRAGFKGDKSCEATSQGGTNTLTAWQRRNAQWSNAACHRSLYSYQARAAIALAVKYEHIAVTFLPLACSGATIPDGLLGSQRARECLVTRTSVNCQGNVNAQVSELGEALATAKKRQPDRRLDLVFLSVGANDIDFSGLVADVIVQNPTDRALFRRSGVLGSIPDSRAALTRELPQRFARLREALRPLVGGDMSRVVFVSYGNPALANGAPCASGRDGFDIHPSFNADPARMAAVVSYVQDEFLPQLKNIALCRAGTICRNPERDRMTLVDEHQAAFANHGVCAHAQTDPVFDQQCFSRDGKSFEDNPVDGAANPMACGQGASAYRAYAPRARWVRTANDSYFAAMTYPQGLSASTQPADIHDALWGVLSAVYGGAVHPSAEGHAAMADAALPAAAFTLGLAAASGGSDITQQPLAPPQ